MLLVVIAIPAGKHNVKKEKKSNHIESLEYTNATYQTSLETQLEQVLRKVEGVGDVTVMLTLKSSTEKIIEKDISQRENTREQTTVYEENNSGEQSPYVSKEITPEIAGVVVIAQGGGSAVTIQNITEAIQALFNVDTHKIKIMKLKS